MVRKDIIFFSVVLIWLSLVILNMIGMRSNLPFHIFDAVWQRFIGQQSYSVQSELIHQGKYETKDVPWTKE